MLKEFVVVKMGRIIKAWERCINHLTYTYAGGLLYLKHNGCNISCGEPIKCCPGDHTNEERLTKSSMTSFLWGKQLT